MHIPTWGPASRALPIACQLADELLCLPQALSRFLATLRTLALSAASKGAAAPQSQPAPPELAASGPTHASVPSGTQCDVGHPAP